MLRAVGGVKQQFGKGFDRAGAPVEQCGSNFSTQLRSARLARGNDGDVAFRQIFFEQPHLRALPAAVDAFECDQFSEPHRLCPHTTRASAIRCKRLTEALLSPETARAS